MANVIRQDVVQIGFEVDDNPIAQIVKEIQELKKAITGVDENDSFEELKQQAQKAKPPINNLKDVIQHVKTKLVDLADKGADKAFNALKKLAGISFKATVAGIGAAAVGIGAIVAKATTSFADYEQLIGGVETLFKDGAGVVQTNANNAFKTAGLSANQYMETVTSFSASLISSLGGDTKKAAEYADMAITDMADNANKMGTDMSLIQNAYQGFAKQNYTMLDNLKLGYGGTKTEMERLIKDASKLDKSIKANDMSFGNIVKAINAVQKKMDIYGATAAEAEKTVTGSLNAMKGAWGNLLTAIGSGENLDQCINNMISSVETFAGNILPVIERALEGAGVVVDKLAPVIAEKLPGMVITLLPPLIRAAGKLIASLASQLPAIIKELMPVVKRAAAEIIRALYEGFTGKKMSGKDFYSLRTTIDGLCKTIKIALPTILGLIAGFKAFKVVKTVVGHISKFAKGVSNIASKVSGGLGEKIKGVGDDIDDTGKKSKNSSKNMLASAKSFMMIGAGVLFVALGFGILAYSAIKLAQAGPLAIGVMFGLVAALAALGFGMMAMLKSISTVGAQAIPAAGAMMMLGGAVILIAAGFGILAHVSIQLANAGGAAIAVMFGLVIALGALMAVAAYFGPLMTAGAVGFLAFGAAMIMCGVAALLFAAAVKLLTPPLIQLVVVVGNVVNTIVNTVGTVLVNCIRTAGESIRTVLDGIAGIFQTFSNGVIGIVDSIGGAISGVLDSIAGIFDSIGNAAKNAGLGFESVANGIAKISQFSIVDLAKSLGAVGDGMATMAKHGEGVALAGQGMTHIVTAMMSIVTASAAVTAAFTSMESVVVGCSTNMLAIVTATLIAIVAKIQSTNLQTAGEQMINGLIVGMNSKKAAAVETARSIAQAINREYAKIQDINSPSGVWEDFGSFQIQGDINGMKNEMPALKSATREVGEMSMPYAGKYTPETSSYSESRSSSVQNNYSPQFSLSIGGSNEDRVLERKVKGWLTEAMDEMFSSMARKSPRVREV